MGGITKTDVTVRRAHAARIVLFFFSRYTLVFSCRNVVLYDVVRACVSLGGCLMLGVRVQHASGGLGGAARDLRGDRQEP